MTWMPAVAFLPAVIVAARQKRIVRRFLEAGADAPERARPLAELGLAENDHFVRRMARHDVLRDGGGGRWWLSTEALARWRRARRGFAAVAVALIVLGVAVALVLAR